jgi:hypothetical protein
MATDAAPAPATLRNSRRFMAFLPGLWSGAF